MEHVVSALDILPLIGPEMVRSCVAAPMEAVLLELPLPGDGALVGKALLSSSPPQAADRAVAAAVANTKA
jgi:hypothetical protein